MSVPLSLFCCIFVLTSRCPQLFPHWRGGFDGARPSLTGIEGERVIGALEGGLLTEQYISGLLHLIREPDVRVFAFLVC